MGNENILHSILMQIEINLPYSSHLLYPEIVSYSSLYRAQPQVIPFRNKKERHVGYLMKTMLLIFKAASSIRF